MPTHHDAQSFDALMFREGADIRSPLLRAVIELYLQKPTHSLAEERHFTELTLRLLDQADPATRAEMAQKLAAYPATPDALLQRIAELTPASVPSRQPASRGRETRALPAAQQPATTTELLELFFAADSQERRLILLNLDPLQSAGERTAASEPGAANRLETAALAHQVDTFMRELEESLGIAPALAYRIVHDPLGEPLVVVAKVLGLPQDALQRVLLFLNPLIGRSVARVYELTALFDELGVGAAQALHAIWRDAEPLNRRHSRADAARRDPRPRQSTDQDRSGSPARDAPRRQPLPRVRASGYE